MMAAGVEAVVAAVIRGGQGGRLARRRDSTRKAWRRDLARWIERWCSCTAKLCSSTGRAIAKACLPVGRRSSVVGSGGQSQGGVLLEWDRGRWYELDA